MHDLVINDAVIHDGTGAPPVHGAVGVDGGRIAAVALGRLEGRETVDADGLALMPGIIDTHTHFDAQVTWDPFVDPSSRLGVTTVIVGNCGFGIAPCRRSDRDLTLRHLTHVEGMSLDALRTGVQWRFESFADYMQALETSGVGLNIAAFIGHSPVRTWVMGDDATKRAATDAEIADMGALVADGMANGALGFASSTFEGHNGENGTPMPSLVAEQQELRALVDAMGGSGRGIFMLTKGSGTKMDFLESLAAESGRPVIVAALLHNSMMPEATFDDLKAAADSQARGHEMFGQVSCCPLTMEFSLKGAYLMESYRAWRPAMAASGDALKAVYADPSFRSAVKDEMADQTALRAFNGDWSRIQVAQVAHADHAAHEGKSIAALAGAAGVHPLDWFLDFGLSESLDTVFTSMLLNSDEEAVGRLLRDPYSSVALSDAGAHLTFFCDAGFGLHLLGHWVREVGLFPLEEAVHRLTGRQADIYRLGTRGRLVPGAPADMLLFDPATVARSPNRRVHDLPGGASRLVCDGIGVHGSWVNGTRILDEQGALVANGHRPGMVLRPEAD